MRSNNLNVFDFDGTLIKVNSFKEITKKLSVVLLRTFQLGYLITLSAWYVLRKSKIVSHLKFKEHVVKIFEKALTEEQKRNICQAVFDENVNKVVFEKMLESDNCVICTAAPFAYVSRVSFKKDTTIISSLDPESRFPSIANFGAGKLENIRAYLRGKEGCVVNFYTDSTDDQELIDFSVNAFMVRNGCLIKVK